MDNFLDFRGSFFFPISKFILAKKGDANKKFFIFCVKQKCQRNNLIVFRVDDRWLGRVGEIRIDVTKYFNEHFFGEV